MYDKRLDAVIAAADTGSFASAGRMLHISTPALAKQINTFEKEYGLKLFTRSRSGVELTSQGRDFVADARPVMHECNEIISRAQHRSAANVEPVRLGVSILRSGRRILDLWQKDAGKHPEIRLELVSLPDNKTTINDIITHLGETVDMVSTAFDTDYWAQHCGTLTLDFEPLCLAIPRNNPLARKPIITLDDLDRSHARIRVLKHRHGGDETARALLAQYPGITLIDIDHYDLDTFNDCAQSGDVMISKNMWAGVHPQLVNVPVDWPVRVGLSYGLLYSLNPSPAVAAFIERIRELAGTSV
ncbi:LysR family transcriptional regulator [Bifidobacterium saguini DSM 23967]|uniref:LysR family transcriptional regulator n=2 Tax=Bifidobacterium saguini TaxID=762210 RepID=A0A087DF13_9BIFI|nr:LysR family transcriptional regulator [Bifidobacterium saguini]KFI94113.1 LysR family transcriptional regulator [Bifidobacterium saguini DSM 23967]QTB90415.1 LysR family transcriptional regulator [Bifidobacterium saguini]